MADFILLHLTTSSYAYILTYTNYMKLSEDYIQATFHQWLWNTYPETRWLCYAIPNGGLRSAAAAAKLKATGLLSGIPDYHIAIPNVKHCGLYIEFKTPEANLNTEHVKHQLDVHQRMRGAGNMVVVCNSIDEAKRITLEYLQGTIYLTITTQLKL